jgi:hypothetical protein
MQISSACKSRGHQLVVQEAAGWVMQNANVAIVACVCSNCTCIAHPKHFQQIADISGHFAILEVYKRKVATIFSAALLFSSSVQQMHVTSQICSKVS